MIRFPWLCHATSSLLNLVFLAMTGAWAVPAHAAVGNAMDRIDFGNRAAEGTHGFMPGVAPESLPVAGVGSYGQAYRQPFGNDSNAAKTSQLLVFTMGCDPVRQNYVTVNAGGESSGSAEATATTYNALESWRFANFGAISNTGNAAAAADGDGWTNAQEYASGTNPNYRTSLLKISTLQANGGDMVVSFPTVSGKTYRLERSGTLQTGSWATVSNAIPGNGSTVQVTDTGGAEQSKRFYRVVVW